jgi:hypothetical protein
VVAATVIQFSTRGTVGSHNWQIQLIETSMLRSYWTQPQFKSLFPPTLKAVATTVAAPAASTSTAAFASSTVPASAPTTAPSSAAAGAAAAAPTGAPQLSAVPACLATRHLSPDLLLLHPSCNNNKAVSSLRLQNVTVALGSKSKKPRIRITPV